MGKSNKLLNFIKYSNFSEDNINYLMEDTGKNITQLIRDSFELIKTCAKSYNNTDYEAGIIYNIVKFLVVLCKGQKFTEKEIEINRERIKRSRASLYGLGETNHSILDAINMLDEITLEKDIDPIALTKLIKILIDNIEDVNIIKKLININKVIVTDNIELFDYVFNKAIEALNNNDRNIYYYITLLKIVYNSKVNRNNYLPRLACYKGNIIVNELKYIVSGVRRPYDNEKILEKYNIIDVPSNKDIYSPYSKSVKNTIVTVDADRTYIRDDALSIRKDGTNYLVNIYVTDAGHEITPGSMVDIDAINNFKSLYLPKHRIHMLNTEIENKISLNKNKPRRTFNLFVVLNDSGEIIDYDLREDQISVSENLTYAAADRILKHADKNHELYFLHDLQYVAEALSDRNKAKRKYWDLKDVSSIHNRNRNYKSDRMISEYMVLYNFLLPTIANDNNMYYIYRGQDKEYISGLMNDLGIKIYGSTRNMLSSLFLDSKYSKVPIRHAGLGVDIYSHSSDAGRRYTDLFNQYLYHQFYFKDIKEFFDEEEFDRIIEFCNNRDRELALMEAEYHRALELKKNS